MKLISSRFEYYNTLYGCVIGVDYVHNGKEQCKPFVPKGRAGIYFKINSKLVSLNQLLNQRFLVRLSKEPELPF